MPFTSKEKQREYQRSYQRRRRKKIRQEDGDEVTDSRISPEVKISIIITILLALAFLSILSFFDLAGPFGVYSKAVLELAFGWGSYGFPILLFILGFLLFKRVRYSPNKSQLVGVVVLFVSLLGALHHAPTFLNSVEAVSNGQGGGYIGLALSAPFVSLAGYWGAWIFLGVLMIVGVLLTLSNIIFGTDEEEEEDFEEEEEEENLDQNRTLLERLAEKLRIWKYRREYNEEEDGEENQDSEEDQELEEDQSDEEEVEESSDDDSEAEPITTEKKKRRKIKIPIDLLEGCNEKPSVDDIDTIKDKIIKTLGTFGIPIEMDEVNVGPTVTQYTLKPPEGVKLSRLTGLANELSLALAAHPLRMEAPIPGKSLVGIEIPNKSAVAVKLKDIITSSSFRKQESNLTICLGKDVSGKPWVDDLAKMPHLLIAGSTGSGKSVAINSLIISLLYQNSPDDLKLVLVDPKKVELTGYNDIPYLLTPVITDSKKTVNALKWVVSEMERRYQLLSNRGKRNIAAYNAANKKETLPYIVFIIDELADLMTSSANDVEAAIVRLAQMSRAVGIHLVLATQRPSVNVITGLIKANVPARMAFVVPSQIDSRTILDSTGAEKLLGRGDMLWLSPELNKPRRLQGAFLSDEEIERVTNFLKEQGEAEYHDEVTDQPVKEESSASGINDNYSSEDDLYGDAKEEVLKAGKASASLLQRRLRIGYARAARLLDILESEGVVGPADGARPRVILEGEEEEPTNEEYQEEGGVQEEEKEEDIRV